MLPLQIENFSTPSSSAPEDSALDIAKIFQTPPEQLTDPLVQKMVDHYREQRGRWAVEESKAQAEGRKPRSTAKSIGRVKVTDVKDLLDLDLSKV